MFFFSFRTPDNSREYAIFHFVPIKNGDVVHLTYLTPLNLVYIFLNVYFLEASNNCDQIKYYSPK